MEGKLLTSSDNIKKDIHTLCTCGEHGGGQSARGKWSGK